MTLLTCPLLARAANVVIVLSENSPVYREFADALLQELRRDVPYLDIVVGDTSHAATLLSPEPLLMVAVGNRAAETIMQRECRTPTLLSLLPRSAYERLVSTRRDDKRISGVYIDQPATRYVDLVRSALPEINRIGILVGRDSRDTAARLATVARERKINVAIEFVSKEHDVFPAIQRLFAEGGVLLALPDTSIFNSQTIPSILLSAYRKRVSVVGFSQAYVKAGAVIALYSTPTQIAIQTAELAKQSLTGQDLPQPQYPRLFKVGVNPYVARSLGMQLDSESSILERLERLEHPQ